MESVGINFIGGTQVTELTVPKTVTSMNYALYGAQNLKKVSFGEGMEKIPGYVFQRWNSYDPSSKVEEIEIPEGVKTIGRSVFDNCDGLSEIKLPESLETIEDGAFMDCDGLKGLVLPKSLKTIKDYAFQDCKGLTEVEIPGSVTNIGTEAFEG